MSDEPLPRPHEEPREEIEPLFAGLHGSSPGEPEPADADEEAQGEAPGELEGGTVELVAPAASVGGVCGILLLFAFLIAVGSIVFILFGE
jgi:hypothetical protein